MFQLREELAESGKRGCDAASCHHKGDGDDDEQHADAVAQGHRLMEYYYSEEYGSERFECAEDCSGR